MRKEFNKRDIHKLIGIEPRRTQFYKDAGLLSDQDHYPGRGNPRQFTSNNLFELAIIKTLSNSGIELAYLKEVFRKARKITPEVFELDYYRKHKDPPGAALIIYGGNDDRKFAISMGREVIPTGNGYARTGSAATKFEVNLKGRKSAIIVHLSELAESIP